jgi:hypothetical protein
MSKQNPKHRPETLPVRTLEESLLVALWTSQYHKWAERMSPRTVSNRVAEFAARDYLCRKYPVFTPEWEHPDLVNGGVIISPSHVKYGYTAANDSAMAKTILQMRKLIRNPTPEMSK